MTQLNIPSAQAITAGTWPREAASGDPSGLVCARHRRERARAQLLHGPFKWFAFLATSRTAPGKPELCCLHFGTFFSLCPTLPFLHQLLLFLQGLYISTFSRQPSRLPFTLLKTSSMGHLHPGAGFFSVNSPLCPALLQFSSIGMFWHCSHFWEKQRLLVKSRQGNLSTGASATSLPWSFMPGVLESVTHGISHQ